MPVKISICLNRGREESVGNDDVKTENPEGTAVGRFSDIFCAVIFRYSFALRVISDILWSSCFESYGPKDTR